MAATEASDGVLPRPGEGEAHRQQKLPGHVGLTSPKAAMLDIVGHPLINRVECDFRDES